MDADAKRLVALKEELRKDLEALERVERLMAAKNSSLSRPDDRQLALPINGIPTKQDAIDTAEEDADNAPSTSLRGKIAEVINSDPNARWTTQRVLAHLQELHFPLKAQKPIYSVGQSLNGLAKRGMIRLVRKGTGSEPNIYKGKIPVGQPSGAEDHSQGGDIGNESTVKE
jgi:hypothetical protein